MMNPFLKTRLDNAFDKPKDVISIQGIMFEDILKTLHDITSSKLSLAHVVLGTAGSGKTHLLTRLWHYSLNPDPMFLFVSIPPPGDIEKIYRHIFRECIASLLQKLDNTVISPLELLITEIIKKVLLEKLPSSELELRTRIEQQSQNLHKLLQTQFRERINNHVLIYTPELYPQIDIVLVKTLLAVYSDFRNTAIHFLQGGMITEKERNTLELPVNQLTEEISSRWLLNILRLTPITILLAADQLESTYYRFKIAGLRKFLDILFSLLESPKIYLLIVDNQKNGKIIDLKLLITS